MIDSIKLRTIKNVSEEVIKEVNKIAINKMARDNRTGEIIYLFTTAELKGTYDNKIMIKIDGYERLVIECSINKLIKGHNVEGDPMLEYLKESVIYLIEYIKRYINIPSYEEYELLRVDYAKNYRLGRENIELWFKQMQNLYYPRRKLIKYGLQTIMFSGQVSTFRAYDKNAEYLKNSFRDLKQIDVKKADEVLLLSQGILRIEIQIRSKKLKYDYDKKENLKIEEIEGDYMKRTYEKELEKVFKVKKENENKIISRNEEVKQRIYSEYDETLASILYSYWLMLSIDGYEATMRNNKKSTHYRKIGMLRKIGVSWNKTDIYISNDKTLFPVDFMLREEYRYMEIA